MDAYLARFDRRIEQEVEFHVDPPAWTSVLGLWTSSCLRAELRRRLDIGDGVVKRAGVGDGLHARLRRRLDRSLGI